jgi:hypothetical protein
LRKQTASCKPVRVSASPFSAGGRRQPTRSTSKPRLCRGCFRLDASGVSRYFSQMNKPTAHDRNAASEWREANREAITASNDWVEAYGLPLQAHRLF